MTKYKKDDEFSYSLGITLTYELLKSRPTLAEAIYVHSKYIKNDVFLEMEEICHTNKIQIIESDKIFNSLSDKENCYIIGKFRKYESNLEDGIHIVLVNPSNKGNLGTILRSALGFGIKNIGIIKPSVDIFDPSVVRASMGAIFDINFEYFNDFNEYLEKYKKRALYPFMLKAKKKLSDVNFNDNSTLIFGPEASGLDDSFLEIGTPVIIPITNNIDSLNLTIAVSIASYEATKNRL